MRWRWCRRGLGGEKAEGLRGEREREGERFGMTEKATCGLWRIVLVVGRLSPRPPPHHHHNRPPPSVVVAAAAAAVVAVAVGPSPKSTRPLAIVTAEQIKRAKRAGSRESRARGQCCSLGKNTLSHTQIFQGPLNQMFFPLHNCIDHECDVIFSGFGVT